MKTGRMKFVRAALLTALAVLSSCVVGNAQVFSIDGNATGRCDDCEPIVRQIDGQITGETGALQANGFQENGIYKDGFFIQTLDEDGSPRTITNITKSSTPVATYTGAILTEGDGLTLGDAGGWSELQGRLIRVRNPDSNSFDVYQDGDDTGYNPTQTTEGNTRTDTSGYSGAFGADMSAQGWIGFADDGDALPVDHDVRLVQTTHTPPANDVGSANAVVPLLGDYFLSTEIHYWKANGVVPSNTDNRPRFSAPLGQGQEFACTEPFWFGWGTFLPSNYDHETTHDGNRSKNQLFLINAKDEGAANNPIEIAIAGRDTGTSDYWEIGYAQGTYAQSQLTLDAGDLDDDVDLWHVFIFYIDMDPTNGILKVWSTTGPDLGGGERAMELLLNRTGAGVGTIGGENGCQLAYRQYKFGWHHSSATIDSTVFWVGLDEIRYGLEANGTAFIDINPWEQNEP